MFSCFTVYHHHHHHHRRRHCRRHHHHYRCILTSFIGRLLITNLHKSPSSLTLQKKACDLLPETSAATVRGVTARVPQGPGPFDLLNQHNPLSPLSGPHQFPSAFRNFCRTGTVKPEPDQVTCLICKN